MTAANVRPLIAAALVVATLSCSDSPTQPQDIAARLERRWIYDPPPTNNPVGPPTVTMDLTTQGANVNGSATWSWIGITTFTMTGTVTGGEVELDGTGMWSGITPVVIHFHGASLGSTLLVGTMILDVEGDSPSAGTMTFKKSQ